jgi:hypothetical protein
MALYMVPALQHKTPQGVLGNFLVGFAPLDTEHATASTPEVGGSKLAWYLDYERARAEALKDNKLIFIDFTGVNCQNCRANETSVFPLPAVKEQLAKFVRVQLYTDIVPKQGLSREQAEKEAEQNSTWQETTFHDSATPLYVVLQPDRRAAVEDGKLKGVELGRYAGFIGKTDVSAFLDMMKNAESKQVAQRD